MADPEVTPLLTMGINSFKGKETLSFDLRNTVASFVMENQSGEEGWGPDKVQDFQFTKLTDFVDFIHNNYEDIKYQLENEADQVYLSFTLGQRDLVVYFDRTNINIRFQAPADFISDELRGDKQAIAQIQEIAQKRSLSYMRREKGE